MDMVQCLSFLILFVELIVGVLSSQQVHQANLKFNYKSNGSDAGFMFMGYYGSKSLKYNGNGRVYYHDTTACSDPTDEFHPPNGSLVVFVDRGACRFAEKIRRIFRMYHEPPNTNLTAVVVVNNMEDNEAGAFQMAHEGIGHDLVTLLVRSADGARIRGLLTDAAVAASGVFVQIGYDGVVQTRIAQEPISRTSVLFVSVSFIILMVISLAWLVFYYVQRFRYVHAKEKLQRRLVSAAKKAIGKMSSRTLRNGDKETDADFQRCAVCIEGYRSGDVIRSLPCSHLFHKVCIDPWLLDHRSCPICKMDILKHYGLQIRGGAKCVPAGASGAATNRDILDNSADWYETDSAPFHDSILPVGRIEMVRVDLQPSYLRTPMGGAAAAAAAAARRASAGAGADADSLAHSDRPTLVHQLTTGVEVEVHHHQPLGDTDASAQSSSYSSSESGGASAGCSTRAASEDGGSLPRSLRLS